MSEIKILICEKDPLLLRALEQALQWEGNHVFCAYNGREAIKIIEREHLDVMLTDVLLPFYSGLELIQKARFKFKHTIFIMVLSFISFEDTIELACQLGADDYMLKPVETEQVLLRILQEVMPNGPTILNELP